MGDFLGEEENFVHLKGSGPVEFSAIESSGGQVTEYIEERNAFLKDTERKREYGIEIDGQL